MSQQLQVLVRPSRAHAVWIALVIAIGTGCSPATKNAPQTPLGSGAGLRVEAGADGFRPSEFNVAPGAPATIEFVRTVEKTCITAVIVAGERHELPLNVPVAVTVNVPAGGAVSFACPMDMYKGTIRAAAAESVGPRAQANGAAENPNAIAYWTCSMHPSVKSQTPGKCPICSMDLVPVTRGEVKTGVILVDAQRRQLIGVMTARAERRALTSEVRAVGRVAMDETRVREVTLRTEAWIQGVDADFVGKSVRKGEPLLTYFSPELFQLQSEYLQVVNDSARGAAARSGAESRLRLRGMEASQIDALAKRGAAVEQLSVNAPISGTVLEKNVAAGSHTAAGMALYRIADLSVVWVEAEVYEQDISRMAAGQTAEISVQGLASREFEGKVAYVYPGMNPTTRTGRVRVEVANPDGALKLDMYAEVRVELPLGERLAVPEGAVIFAGTSHVAFVDLGEGRLEPRRLKVGARTADYVEVLEGLKEGETVVTSGNFLIAAESKLKSGIEKW